VSRIKKNHDEHKMGYSIDKERMPAVINPFRICSSQNHFSIFYMFGLAGYQLLKLNLPASIEKSWAPKILG